MALADAKPFAVAYWGLDELSGTRFDSVGSNHLTDNNTVGSAAGKFGNAADFESANSEFLSIDDNADVSMGDIDFCIRVWVKMESSPGSDATIVTKRTGNTGTGLEYTLAYATASDRFRFFVSGNGSTSVFGSVLADNLGSPSADTWYLIHAWHDATNDEVGIAVNAGTANVTSYSGGVVNGGNAFRIGGSDGVLYFDGLIDQVVLLKGYILEATERAEDYKGGAGVAFEDWDPITVAAAATESFTLADEAAAIMAAIAAATESLQLADAPTGRKVVHASSVESVDLGDAPDCAAALLAAASDGLSLADAETSTLAGVATATESVAVSDSAASSLVAVAAASESVAWSDSETVNAALLAAVNEAGEYPGLVAFWKLDDTTSLEGNFDLTNDGGVTFDTGHLGDASYHSGQNSGLTIAFGDAGPLEAAQSEAFANGMTVGGWAYLTQAPGGLNDGRAIMGGLSRSHLQQTSGWCIGVGVAGDSPGGDSKPAFIWAPAGDVFFDFGDFACTGAEDFPLNQWTHLLFRFDPEGSPKGQLFVNGEVDGTSDGDFDFGAQGGLQIGRLASDTYPFIGRLDTWGVWDVPLTDSQIAGLAAGVDTPPAIAGLNIAESAASTTALPVAASETLQLSDSATAVAALLASATESFTVSEAVASIAAYLAACSDSLTLSDAESAEVGQFGNATESLTLAEEQSARADLLAAESESLTLTDAAIATGSLLAAQTEAVAFSDAFAAAAANLLATASEASTWDDQPEVGASLHAHASETVQWVDTVAADAPLTAHVAETLSLADTPTARGTFRPTVQESVSWHDAPTGSLAAITSASESITVHATASVATSGVLEAVAAESFGLAEAVACAMMAEGEVAEALAMTDAVVVIDVQVGSFPAGTDPSRVGATSITVTSLGLSTTASRIGPASSPARRPT